jgi:hypothetical protein
VSALQSRTALSVVRKKDGETKTAVRREKGRQNKERLYNFGAVSQEKTAGTDNPQTGSLAREHTV